MDLFIDLDIGAWTERLNSYGTLAILVGIAAIALQSVIPVVPFLVLAGANVLVFGLFQGFLINWAGSVIGAGVLFALARFWGQKFIRAKWSHQKYVHWFNDQLKQRGFWIILLVRMFPIIPPSLVSILSGMSEVTFTVYFTATLLGKLPATWLGSILSHDVIYFDEHKGRLGLILALVVAISAIGIYVRKRIGLNRTSE